MTLREWFNFIRWAVRRLKSEYQQEIVLSQAHIKTASGVTIVSPQNLVAGDDVYIDYGSYIHCGGLEWCDFNGKVTIGRGSYIGPQCVLFGMGEIEIGEDVMISPNVVISTVQHSYENTDKPMYKQPRRYGKIIIEDDVWICSNVVIVPGKRIGKGSVIGAGAVVTKDIEPYSVVVGVPAREIKKRK